jgi:hypothetical protein
MFLEVAAAAEGVMKDGLYRVEFQTQRGAGAGVVFLEGGTLRGGDSQMFYTGSYSENGGQFTAEVQTDVHTRPSISVFGMDRVHIRLSGTTNGDSALMTGTATEAPGITFRAVLKRLAG